MYFRNIVSDYREEYLGLKSQDWVLKNRVAHKVIKKVTKKGGRFLKRNGDRYIEVDNATRLEKTKQGESLETLSVFLAFTGNLKHILSSALRQKRNPQYWASMGTKNKKQKTKLEEADARFLEVPANNPVHPQARPALSVDTSAMPALPSSYNSHDLESAAMLTGFSKTPGKFSTSQGLPTPGLPTPALMGFDSTNKGQQMYSQHAAAYSGYHHQHQMWYGGYGHMTGMTPTAESVGGAGPSPTAMGGQQAAEYQAYMAHYQEYYRRMQADAAGHGQHEHQAQMSDREAHQPQGQHDAYSQGQHDAYPQGQHDAYTSAMTDPVRHYQMMAEQHMAWAQAAKRHSLLYEAELRKHQQANPSVNNETLKEERKEEGSADNGEGPPIKSKEEEEELIKEGGVTFDNDGAAAGEDGKSKLQPPLQETTPKDAIIPTATPGALTLGSASPFGDAFFMAQPPTPQALEAAHRQLLDEVRELALTKVCEGSEDNSDLVVVADALEFPYEPQVINVVGLMSKKGKGAEETLTGLVNLVKARGGRARMSV